MSNEQQVKAMAAILNAVVETVKESGTLGAPCSSIYLALSAKGCSLESYNKIESTLIIAGKVRKEFNCLFAV